MTDSTALASSSTHVEDRGGRLLADVTQSQLSSSSSSWKQDDSVNQTVNDASGNGSLTKIQEKKNKSSYFFVKTMYRCAKDSDDQFPCLPEAKENAETFVCPKNG